MEVRQISDEEVKQTLTKEELQQTQVLNYKEVQKAIRFEKITSKRPAIMVAIVGVLSLILGGSIQIANTLHSTPQTIQKRDTKKDIEIVEKSMNCTKTTLNNSDGTNTTYNIDYKFENNELVGLTKEYNVSAAPGNDEGKKSIEKYKTEYQKLINESDGYKINMTTTDTTITIKVTVDYKKLDLTKIKEIQQTKYFTKLDYNKYETYSKIKTDMLENGYTVE